MAETKTPALDKLYADLMAKRAELQAILAPAREFYEKHVNDPRLIEARKIIKQVSALLIPIENEIAGLARAKGSKGIKIESGSFSTK